MSIQVKRRREAASFLATYVGAPGELLVDTTNNRVQVHDGATPGGFPAAKITDLVQRAAVADANYAALAGDRTIAFTAMTAARIVQLPAATAYPTGTQLLVVDESGACSAANTITLARSGSDTINGAASVAVASPFGYVALESNGAAKWTVVDQAVPASGGASATGLGRTQVNDAAYTVLASDRTVAFIALTAARTVTLPAAGAYPAGATLMVLDESGSCSNASTLTLAAAGTDRINGSATAVIATAYGYLALESNTSNKWTVVDAPAPVTSVAGRGGAVALGVTDVSGAAPLASPALTGIPTAPNAGAGTSTAQIATTSFVAASFVTYAYAAANYAPTSNATLTGTPTAPTQSPKDNSTRLATTAYADAAVAAVLARTQVNDAAYTALATDRTVAFIALTAARTVTLPAASAYPAGATLTIVDESGGCSPAAAITVAAAGSDLINGAGSAVLSLAYGYVALESNTFNKWTQVDFGGVGIATTPQLTNRNVAINGNFAINQRGYASNTALSAGAYGHDRWKAGSGGATYTFMQAVPDTQATITAGSLLQVVEGANMAASTMWLTWTGTASARVTQGSTSSQTSPAYAAGTPTTFGGVSVNVLAVTGLTPGTNTSVELTGGSVGLVQLEVALPNAGPTRFERRQIAQETLLCQRYYEAGSFMVLSSAYAANAFLSVNPCFKASKRVAPSITASPAGGVNASYQFSDSATLDCFRLVIQSTAASTNVQMTGTWTANAEL